MCEKKKYVVSSRSSSIGTSFTPRMVDAGLQSQNARVSYDSIARPFLSQIEPFMDNEKHKHNCGANWGIQLGFFMHCTPEVLADLGPCPFILLIAEHPELGWLDIDINSLRKHEFKAFIFYFSTAVHWAFVIQSDWH